MAHAGWGNASFIYTCTRWHKGRSCHNSQTTHLLWKGRWGGQGAGKGRFRYSVSEMELMFYGPNFSWTHWSTMPISQRRLTLLWKQSVSLDWSSVSINGLQTRTERQRQGETLGCHDLWNVPSLLPSSPISSSFPHLPHFLWQTLGAFYCPYLIAQTHTHTESSSAKFPVMLKWRINAKSAGHSFIRVRVRVYVMFTSVCTPVCISVTFQSIIISLWMH